MREQIYIPTSSDLTHGERLAIRGAMMLSGLLALAAITAMGFLAASFLNWLGTGLWL